MRSGTIGTRTLDIRSNANFGNSGVNRHILMRLGCVASHNPAVYTATECLLDYPRFHGWILSHSGDGSQSYLNAFAIAGM